VTLLRAEIAADAVIAGWRGREDVVLVPWFWRPVMEIVRMNPERIFQRTFL
jgi:hypothetical protein